jgi:hypothetical protein
MDKKLMKRMVGIAIPMALIITGINYNGYIRTHTFTLSGGVVKNEQIQPINNKFLEIQIRMLFLRILKVENNIL